MRPSSATISTQIEEAAMHESDGRGGKLSDQTDWKRRVALTRLSVNALEMIEMKIVSEIAKGRAPGPQTSLTKLLASNLRQEIDLLAVDLYGPAGLQLENRGARSTAITRRHRCIRRARKSPRRAISTAGRGRSLVEPTKSRAP